MTRIRYTVNKENGLFVSKAVMAGTDLVTVTLDVQDLSATLTGADGSVVAKHYATTLPLLKKAVKQVLIQMGALFNDDVRNGRSAVEETTENQETVA